MTEKRAPKQRRRIAAIKLSVLREDPDRAARAARQRGGVDVIDDASGRCLFRLSIPMEPLSDLKPL